MNRAGLRLGFYKTKPILTELHLRPGAWIGPLPVETAAVNAFATIGGVPLTLVPDNLKAPRAL